MTSSQEVPRRAPAGSAGREAELAVLITRIARGDQTAYEEFYDRTASAVLGMVLHVIRDRAQSEEVMQEVLLEAWRTASRFDLSQGTALSWLMTLAHRRAVDRVRSEQRAMERERRASVAEIDYDQVSEAVEATLDAERVRKCLGALTPLQRESVLLAYYGGYSYNEVATLLGVPAGTVKTRMRDGLIRIRDCMGADSLGAEE
jgi:RNA polymerase sigma-70 factor, ECF subfamily